MEPLLNVVDVRQFVYCPRVVFYTWVMPVRPPATFLMKRGQKVEEEFARLEPRRTLARYGLEDSRRHFSLQMTDSELGLTGKCDLVLEAPDRVAVVEFKATASALFENQRVQLAAYALLAERHFHLPCPCGFVILKDRKLMPKVEVGTELREQVMELLGRVRSLIQEPVLPPPTPVRARCTGCEYRNFCGDIF
ncbi:MAG: CRISPR-associated protein Cas4 [Terriglobia bacterium]